MANVSSDVMNGLNDRFLRRVDFFMKKAAVAILAEVVATAGHTERVAYAKLVLDGTASVREFATGVGTNTTVATVIVGGDETVTDSDLEFTVNSLFSAYAGFASGT